MAELITQKLVDGLENLGKQYYRTDTRIPGFVVRVSSSGKRTFALKMKVSGKLKEFSLASCDDVSVSEAREMAQDKRNELLKEKSEKKKKSDNKSLRTLKDMFEDHLENQVSKKYDTLWLEYEQQSTRNRFWPKHLAEKNRCYQRVYKYFSEDYKVENLSVLELENFHKFRSKTGKVAANRDIYYISIALESEIRYGTIKTNYAKYVELNAERNKKLGLPAERLKEFFQHLDTYHNRVAVAAVKFAIFTGLRHSEVVSLHKRDRYENNYFDVKNKTIYLRDHKTADKTDENVIAVNDFAIAVLPKFRFNSLEEKNIHVFASGFVTSITTKTMSKAFNHAKKRMNFTTEENKKITPYSTRHTFASLMLKKKVSFEDVAQMLGHKDTTMLKRRYATLDEEFRDNLRNKTQNVFSDLELMDKD
ncbi:hypothetical protein B9057_09885 [Aestuarium zhoushanense]|nr:hypothetical protein B9057_09885 [Aestuarium zhoushanense]